MAAVDASPRPELDPNTNTDSANPPSTPPQNPSSAETPNSLPNPSPSVTNPHPSTPVQASSLPPSFISTFGHIGMQQYGGGVMSTNPSFAMGVGLQPPGVGTSQASPMMRPVGMFQQMQYGQVQNGYMAAGAIPPPGVVMPRFPAQFPFRPGFAPPRPMPQIMRPNLAGIHPVMSPLLRPVIPVPVEKPQTTVYIGKIAPTVDNDFLMSLLKLCGPVKSWKRAQDPSDGKPKGFGFCEFEGAEGILRALRLLSKLNLDGQELVLNINQATREYLEKYVEKKTEREKLKETESLLETSDPSQSQTETPKSTTEESKKESPKDSSKDLSKDSKEFGVVNDEDRNADKDAVEKMESMLEERSNNLPPPPPLPVPNADSANRTEIVSRVKDDWDSDQIRSGEKNSEGDVSESNKGGNEVEVRSRKERSREREKERSNRDKEREVDRYERDRERDRVKREREREDRVRHSDRQLKDKLKDWENREREREYQRHHERDREKERERERKREVVKQEDESDDEEYNNNNERDRKRRRRGGNNNINNTEERKRKRQREKEEDVSDRFKEEEETEEEMRREKELEKERLLREEELDKEKELEKEKEEQIKREIYVKDAWNEMYGPAKEERESVEPMQVDLNTDYNSNTNNNNNNNSNEETTELGQENIDSKLNTNNNGATKKLGFGLFGSGKKTSVPSVFQQEEEEEQNDKKMRPLIPIDYSAEELQAISQTDSNEEAIQMNNNNSVKRNSSGKEKKKEERKKVLDAKQLIDMIPKTKEELFSYPINWTVYDKHGLNDRMRPWVSKKITEFLGEEEETLVDYIVSCTKDHVEASKLLELLQAILDEEAEMFVLKMWRMLIFEIKKVETGITKGK